MKAFIFCCFVVLASGCSAQRRFPIGSGISVDSITIEKGEEKKVVSPFKIERYI